MEEELLNTKTYIADINNSDKINEIINKISSIDILVNNAAIQIEKPFKENSDQEIDLVMNANIISLVKLTNKVIKKLMIMDISLI